jgi:hypothetical protein
VVSGLDTQLDIYRSPIYSCPIDADYSFRCGSMLLGMLLKEMELKCFSSPRPRAPYFGQSFDVICDTARTMESEIWYHNKYEGHGCSLSTAVASIVDAAVASVEGLGLRKT